MQLTEFNKIVQDYNNQIKKLNDERDNFIASHRESLTQHQKKRQDQEREWFVKNFDKIWLNKHLYSLGTPNASIIVDCFKIHRYVRCGAGCGWIVKKLSLGKLIKLWESGYLYKGYPIIEYHDTPLTNKVTYIKDNQLHIANLKEEGIKLEFSRLCMQILRSHDNRIDDFSIYKTVSELKNII